VRRPPRKSQSKSVSSRGITDSLSYTILTNYRRLEEHSMARKTIRVSDMSGQEIAEGKGATIRITFADARKGVRELDVTDAEAEKLGGRSVARRGRKPRAAVA
jgi:hypothetical protein